MFLDPKTIIALNLAGTILAGFGMMALSFRHLSAIREMRPWAWATFLQSAGWLIFGALRGTLPDLVSIVLGNAILLWVMIAYRQIIARFLGLPPGFLPGYLLLAATQPAALAYFTLVPDLSARGVVIAACGFFPAFDSARLLWKKRENKPSHLFMASVWGALALVLLSRAMYGLLAVTAPGIALAANAMTTVLFASLSLVSATLTIGFMLMCVERFVGEMQNAREALKESELRHKALYEQTPAIMHSIDTEGHLIDVSDRWLETLGYDRDSVIGRPITEFLREKAPGSVTESALADLVRTGQSSHVPYLFVRKTGDPVDVLLSATPERDRSGAIVGSLAVLEDVSERARVELARLQLLLQLEATLNALPDLLFEVQRDGLIVDYRAPDKSLLYAPPEHFLGKLMQEILPKDAAASVAMAIEEAATTGQSRGHTYCLDLADGKHWFELSVGGRSNPATDVARFVTLIRDITERKRTEEDLLQARDDAEAATRAKSYFLATMSHELRTPLNGVIGAAELLGTTPLAPEQSQYLSIIEASGRTLRNIITDTLDYSKIESGKLEIQSQPFDLEEALDVAVAIATASIPKASISVLRAALPADVPQFVSSDPARLNQILLNLLANAIKYTDRGSVHLEVRRVEGPSTSDLSSGIPVVEFAVVDTGVGIPQQFLVNLFKPFEQLDQSTTRKHGGTGLGLAICVELVKLLGGELQVKSALGRGSRFFFAIPLPPAARQVDAASATGPAAAMPRALNILIAEDNIFNQRILMAMLAKSGYEARLATDGAEAFAWTEREEFDLVFMDMQMPIMDGLEATRRIREREGPRRVVIAGLTANTSAEDRELCLSAGMDYFLAKPFQMIAIERILADVGKHRPERK